ncbi:MAG: MTH1187 family thiamine-binding protein [Candidatus Aminicenantales bacterium]
MIIASLAIFPTSEGVSVSRYVRKAVEVIQNSGLKHATGGMSTTIEAPDMETLLNVVAKAHNALVEMGVRRIHIDLHVDHRLDKDATIASKLKALDKT